MKITKFVNQITAKIGKKVAVLDWTICKLWVKISNCIRGFALFFKEAEPCVKGPELGNCGAFTEK